MLSVGDQRRGHGLRAGSVSSRDRLCAAGATESAGVVGRPSKNVSALGLVGQRDRDQWKVDGWAPDSVASTAGRGTLASGEDVQLGARSPWTPVAGLGQRLQTDITSIDGGEGGSLQRLVVNVGSVCNGRKIVAVGTVAIR